MLVGVLVFLQTIQVLVYLVQGYQAALACLFSKEGYSIMLIPKLSGLFERLMYSIPVA